MTRTRLSKTLVWVLPITLTGFLIISHQILNTAHYVLMKEEPNTTTTSPLMWEQDRKHEVVQEEPDHSSKEGDDGFWKEANGGIEDEEEDIITPTFESDQEKHPSLVRKQSNPSMTQKGEQIQPSSNQIASQSDRTSSQRPYPTYLVIVKSPRSGSTFFESLLKQTPNMNSIFEPTLSMAKSHFSDCHKRGLSQQRRGQATTTTSPQQQEPWGCAISVNDYLKEDSEHRFDQINDLVETYNATLVIQLRSNVVEKAISSEKLWGTLQHTKLQDMTPDMGRTVKNSAMDNLNTIRGHVNAAKFIPGSTTRKKQPLWIWYEDLISHCDDTLNKVYNAIGFPEQEMTGCRRAHFRNETYPTNLLVALEQEPALVPMMNAYKYNTEVDTNVLYEQYKKETANMPMKLGFWR